MGRPCRDPLFDRQEPCYWQDEQRMEWTDPPSALQLLRPLITQNSKVCIRCLVAGSFYISGMDTTYYPSHVVHDRVILDLGVPCGPSLMYFGRQSPFSSHHGLHSSKRKDNHNRRSRRPTPRNETKCENPCWCTSQWAADIAEKLTVSLTPNELFRMDAPFRSKHASQINYATTFILRSMVLSAFHS